MPSLIRGARLGHYFQGARRLFTGEGWRSLTARHRRAEGVETREPSEVHAPRLDPDVKGALVRSLAE